MENEKKAIEEMANEICSVCHAYKNCVNTTPCTMAYKEAEELYQGKGYRKQIEGEWVWKSNGYMKYLHCSCCGKQEDWEREYRPNCGAHMKGGAE